MGNEQEQSLLSLSREWAPPGPPGEHPLFENNNVKVTHIITIEKAGNWKDSIIVVAKPPPKVE